MSWTTIEISKDTIDLLLQDYKKNKKWSYVVDIRIFYTKVFYMSLDDVKMSW